MIGCEKHVEIGQKLPKYAAEPYGRLLPGGLQGWPLKFVKHVADATGVSPSPAGPPGSCPLYLLHLSNLSFMIGMPNRCCILKLRSQTNVLYATSLVCLDAKAKLHRRKPNVLVALSLVHVRNLHPGANLHPGCIFDHVNGILRICTRV